MQRPTPKMAKMGCFEPIRARPAARLTKILQNPLQISTSARKMSPKVRVGHRNLLGLGGLHWREKTRDRSS